MVVQEFRLRRHPLAVEPQPLNDGAALLVPGRTADLNAVQLEFFERVVHEPPARFRDDAVTLELRPEPVPDLDALIRPVDAVKPDHTSQLAAEPDAGMESEIADELLLRCEDEDAAVLYGCLGINPRKPFTEVRAILIDEEEERGGVVDNQRPENKVSVNGKRDHEIRHSVVQAR